MERSLSAVEIAIYLEAVLGEEPLSDAQGRTRLRCPCRSTPEHFIILALNSGQWFCEGGCGRGDIFDFEEWRSRAFGFRQAEVAVLKIIHDAQEKARKAEPTVEAVHIECPKDLPFDARKLLTNIARHPYIGQSRRHLQQTAHLYRHAFRTAIRLLERRRLVLWRDEPSTGGRRRRTYFPRPAGER